MTEDKGIFIKNIYYMLSYAFQILKQSNFQEVDAEMFEKIQDLFASILSKGVSMQVKQGLIREYITRHESLSALRGKLDMPETIHNRIQRRQKLACEFDELSENNMLNQILKTTMHYLIRDGGVNIERKMSLRKVLVYFSNVDLLLPSDIKWGKLQYHRHNQNYEMLINICYFVLDGMLQTTEKGVYRMMSFSDDHMAKLYEKFILEYYRQHHNYLSEVHASQVKWNLIGDYNEVLVRFLPVMQTDITLKYKNKVLIIDAKYYGKTFQMYHDKHTLHSGNLYQIYAYVKNLDKNNSGNVAGLLLYAKTQESITPDLIFNIGNNQIGAKTLDLNQKFNRISSQLDDIVEKFLGDYETS